MNKHDVHFIRDLFLAIRYKIESYRLRNPLEWNDLFTNYVFRSATGTIILEKETFPGYCILIRQYNTTCGCWIDFMFQHSLFRDYPKWHFRALQHSYPKSTDVSDSQCKISDYGRDPFFTMVSDSLIKIGIIDKNFTVYD